MSISDRYYFELAPDVQCGKIVHFFGNIYDNEDGRFQHAEWTGMYLPLDDVLRMRDDDTLYEYLNEKIAYLGDITEEEADSLDRYYYDGEPGKEVVFANITTATPVGYYYADSLSA